MFLGLRNVVQSAVEPSFLSLVGKRACFGYGDGMIKVWDLKQGSVLATVAGGKKMGQYSVKMISTWQITYMDSVAVKLSQTFVSLVSC